VPAVVGIIRRAGRLLLTRRARPPYAGSWDLPGGFLEGGELPEAGLKRELREELAVKARGIRLIGFATDRYGPRGFPVLTMVYRVTIGRAEVRPGTTCPRRDGSIDARSRYERSRSRRCDDCCAVISWAERVDRSRSGAK